MILSINIVPGSAWNQKDQQHVELLASDDKRQITAFVCESITGNFLLFQLIYQGKITACLPKVTLPSPSLTTVGPMSRKNVSV